MVEAVGLCSVGDVCHVGGQTQDFTKTFASSQTANKGPAAGSIHYTRHCIFRYNFSFVNPLTGTLKPQSNGPLYSNTVIGTLAVDGWAVTFGTARRGPSSLYQM